MQNENIKPEIVIILGSKSDHDHLSKATEILERFNVPYEVNFCSAHRQHSNLHKIINKAEENKVKAIIAGAGLAAHLPGVIASHTLIPVIGVPIPAGTLGGLDALLSIVQMPRGVPVACVGIGMMENAVLLALQIIAMCGDEKILEKLKEYRSEWLKA